MNDLFRIHSRSLGQSGHESKDEKDLQWIAHEGKDNHTSEEANESGYTTNEKACIDRMVESSVTYKKLDLNNIASLIHWLIH